MRLISNHPVFLLINHAKTLSQLQQLHAQAITRGLLTLYPSLILTKILYTLTLVLTPLTPLTYALSIFNRIPSPSTFCYNNIIRLHTLLSSPLSALLLFAQMRRHGVPPDAHTFPFALKACAHLRSLELTGIIHSQALKMGFGSDIFVINTLIHVYSNSGCLHDACRVFDESATQDVVSYNALIDGLVKASDTDRARQVFDKMSIRDAVSWGTLLAGYAQMKQCKQAIELFAQMLSAGVRPDNVALVSALSACAQLEALERGRSIHCYILRQRIRVDAFLSTGLVDMYAKCGCIDAACDIFEMNPDKNLFTWNALLVGLAMHGHGKLCLEYLSRMTGAGIQPDDVSFLGVLVGCSHAGLINEARRIFNEMERVYGVRRELKHYGCMADLLGRSGLIAEAKKMIEGMPMEADVFVWGALLGGCRIQGDVEVAEIAADHVARLDPEGGGVYTVMANIYAGAKRWRDVATIRRVINGKGIKKCVGRSSIRLNGVTHEFIAGETLHPQIKEIYSILNGIGSHQIGTSSSCSSNIYPYDSVAEPFQID